MTKNQLTLFNKNGEAVVELTDFNLIKVSLDDHLKLTDSHGVELVEFEKQTSHIFNCRNLKKGVQIISFDNNLAFSTQALVSPNPNNQPYSICVFGKYAIINPDINSPFPEVESHKITRNTNQSEQLSHYEEMYSSLTLDELIAEKQSINKTPGWTSSKATCLAVLGKLIEDKSKMEVSVKNDVVSDFVNNGKCVLLLTLDSDKPLVEETIAIYEIDGKYLTVYDDDNDPPVDSLEEALTQVAAVMSYYSHSMLK